MIVYAVVKVNLLGMLDIVGVHQNELDAMREANASVMMMVKPFELQGYECKTCLSTG